MKCQVISNVFALVVITAFSVFGFAEGFEDKTLSPYFFVEGDPSVDQLPLKDTRVEIAVSGVIADAIVLQTYQNEGSRPINAQYVFPGSTRAAVYAMKMRIGNQVIVAKIKEKQQAKQEFEVAKKQGKSASLLEQNRPNVFSMSVANVMPGERVQIELRYTELLIPTDGVYELVFPTVVGPRYSSQPGGSVQPDDSFVKTPYLKEGSVPKTAFHLTSVISGGMPIQELMCPSHQIVPQWKNPAVVQIDVDPSDAFHANRDFILRYRLNGQEISSGLLLYQGKDENFFLYTAQPPVRTLEADIPPREYIFVVDVSGSMYGFPLDTSKQLLRDLIGHLRPSDLFNIVLFAGDARTLSPTSISANQQNVTHAIQLIDSQRGGGGTELLNAIERALTIPRQESISRTVVLVTDGYIEAEAKVFQYIRSNLSEANVFSFGIGSSVNHYLIEGVAKAGMGEPFVVTHPQEAEAVATKFREYIQTPVLTDIHVRWNGLDLYDVQPTSVPDLFAQRPIILYGKWRGALNGSFEIEGKTGRGVYVRKLDVSGFRPDESNRALRYLWARSRIAELSDYGSQSLDQERIKEITTLGLTYNLLTQYTSFIAVRELVTNTQGSAQDVNQPLVLPQRVGNFAVGGSVAGQSEPELIWFALLFALIFAYALFCRRSELKSIAAQRR